MRRVRIHAAAAEEAAQAAAWYERERPGLGVDFERAVDAALRDAALYELLALVDAIRDGRARERNLAQQALEKRLGGKAR